MSHSMEAWWKGLGPVAMCILCFSVLLTISCTMNWTNPYTFAADWEAILLRRELWRCFTSFFFLGKLDFHFLLGALFLVEYENRLEIDIRSISDHLYLNCFVWLGGLCTSFCLDIPYVNHLFLVSLVSIWSRNHAGERLTIYFFTIEAQYYPFVLLLINYSLTGELVQGITGICLGNIYYYLRNSVPAKYGMQPLKTPSWFVSIVNLLSCRSNALMNQGIKSFDAHQFGLGWGKGRRLGD
ncbi:Der1like family [Perkinsela sp. CCAP 1560/4]|nr:Der1like family [Perkinsela sp. CCAP 1560/4]|eukprot:KNH06289.1 Der1like family [Perkinsela sp. CCAP 1560/4]